MLRSVTRWGSEMDLVDFFEWLIGEERAGVCDGHKSMRE